MTYDNKISKVAVIGSGVIGASWAALFLARGYHVTVVDPAPNAEEGLTSMLEKAWPALTQIADAPAEIPFKNLSFTRDTKAAVADVDVIQENGPENLDFKLKLYKELDENAPAHTLICSSSSGLRMGDIQKACALHPERTLIAHPFNPPHLLPLVELVGGPATSEAAIAKAREFYESLGKKTITLKKEVIGHVANRLQAALFREVTHLVKEGVVSVADADDAVRYGPGLRWSVMGQCMLYHLGAGDSGLAGMLDKFGPAIDSWWDDLGKPHLDIETKALLVAGAKDEAGEQTIAELSAIRDRMLISRLKGS